MEQIALLDDDTIDKIAAGEVVERPASVIKELVENSLDAGASRIEVEIAAGGTSFMRVTDNGRGMDKKDALLSVKRHATSKIRSVHDLESISTLGFRGEALPTIASVSHFTLITRPHGEELASMIEIDGGGDPRYEEIGAGLGTTIKVLDLFFNTPARKKFLKTNHTEGGRISDFVTKLSLSRPDVAFKLISNQKQTMSTPGNGNLLETFRSIYGKTVTDDMLTIDFTEFEPSTLPGADLVGGRPLKIHGFVSKPTLLKSSRAWQTLLVNGRLVQSHALSKAIDNAYATMIPKRGYPMAVVSVEIEPREIDVNVHPQKAEVRFADEGRVFRAVYNAVLNALRPSAASVAPMSNLKDVAVNASENIKNADKIVFQVPFSTGEPSNPSAASNFAAPSLTRTRELLPPLREKTSESQISVTDEAIDGAKASGLMPIGQLGRCYIIAKDAEGMYIVDQHAAHERILYDKLSQAAGDIPSQPLLMHLVLTLSTEEVELAEKNLTAFADLGFGLSVAGPTELRLTEVPMDIPVGEAENIIREIMADLREMRKVSAGELRHEIIAVAACRGAIKAGDELSYPQMEKVLKELSATAKPYTCPHGRPTILKFTTGELDKMFKRTGF